MRVSAYVDPIVRSMPDTDFLLSPRRALYKYELSLSLSLWSAAASHRPPSPCQPHEQIPAVLRLHTLRPKLSMSHALSFQTLLPT